MSAALTKTAALAELRVLAHDLAKGLAREDWRGKPAAPPPSVPLKRPVGTAHARDRAKFESAFTNQILAELFDAAHSAGALRVLPRTDGKYVVFDPRKPVATATVAGPFEGDGALDRADAAMRALHRKETVSCLP